MVHALVDAANSASAADSLRFSGADVQLTQQRVEDDALDNTLPSPRAISKSPIAAAPATAPTPRWSQQLALRAEPSAAAATSSAGGGPSRPLGAEGYGEGQSAQSRQLGQFFLSNLGFFMPFLVPGLLPFFRQLAKGMPPPFDYLLNEMTGSGTRGMGTPPTRKQFRTCAPRAPPPFSSEPPPAPPLFPVQTHMPEWDLLTPGAAPSERASYGFRLGAAKTHPEEPDGWWRGEVNGRFSGQSAVGKVVERYPTQGVQYPFSSGATPPSEPLAHTQSPALDGFSQPAIWLELGAGALPPPRAAPAFAYRARAAAAERVAWRRPPPSMRLRFSHPL